MNISDNVLIARYQEGDEEALETLIQKHKEDLFSFIFRKVLDEELASDFFQDAFVKIIIKLKENKYREENKFILWAKKIAYNLIMDHYRIKYRYNKISETTFHNEDFCIFDTLRETEHNIEEQLIITQIHEDLHHIIIHLPKNQQEIIRMRFYDNLSFKEIADLTNTSINTVLGRMRYALINIRKIITENKINLSI